MKLFCKSALLGVFALGACENAPDPRHTNFRVERDNVIAQYDDRTGRLTRLEVDRDRNGVIETWSFWDGTRILRIEVDQDEDGVVDRWEHYDERARLTKVGTSSLGDGVEDTWSYASADGALARVEADVNRDGHLDKWETYGPPRTPGGAPTLRTVGLDPGRTGRPTTRLHYNIDGSLDRVERLEPR